ncbi:hypothetical protein LSUB1_G001911 [Lachnellula subtilissima]|uniref:Xylanolytic transcriptional activator regulatory domain-containing protein n=1 Tax=Lachnellula subtilissima TaxID=602034 RepID=A0A8H8RY08_9HELO|nr:hypothetical protein LSUB1_G001911 [Lachnellula subtilissima]
MDPSQGMEAAFNGLLWDTTALHLPSPMPTIPTYHDSSSPASSRIVEGDNQSKTNAASVKFQAAKNGQCAFCVVKMVGRKPGPAKGSVGLRLPVLEEPSQRVRALQTTGIDSISSAMDLNLAGLGIAIVMDAKAEQELIDLYFAHIQPSFPMFCKKTFMQEFAEKRIPDKLLNAFFAVSLGFLPPYQLSSLFGSSSNNARQMFAQLAEQQGHDQIDTGESTTLNDVRFEVLLTLYNYTNFPGRKAWLAEGTMMRSAIGMGLHRVDSGVRNPLHTDFELEEQRFVWWSVWKLDTSINCLAASPFGIDSHSIGTAIISTSISAFETGLGERSTNKFLPSDSTKPWKLAQELLATDTEDGVNMYLLAACHLRSVSLCRQRLYTNPTPDMTSHLMTLRNTLSCMRLSLPTWYLQSARQSDLETPERHRFRLETILILYMAQVQAFLPFANVTLDNLVKDDDFGNWNECVSICENIASILHHWRPEYSMTADPMISTIIWFAWFILTTHTMCSFGESTGIPDVNISNALDLLTLTLELFARHWKISRLLLDSTENLQIWAWTRMDFSEILSLVEQLRVPIDPQKQCPGAVDMWEILRHREETSGAADFWEC